MKKLIVIVAVIAALFSIPATRSRMVMVSQPVLTKLGPFGERIITPARRYNAKTEATALLRMIAELHAEGRTVPDARGFARWTRQKLKEEAPDPWGNPYWLERKPGTLTIGSSGVDGRRGTPDDVTTTSPF